MDNVSNYVTTYHGDLDIYNDYFTFTLLQFMLKEIDHLDSISPVDRNDKMIVEIVNRLKKLNEKTPELKEMLERNDQNGHQ